MTTNDVLRALTPLIRAHTGHLPAAPPALTADTRLEQDLRMDSMAIVHVLEDIEDTFGLTIPDERLAGVYTVGDLVDIVRTAAEAPERVA
ncbi:phosphopantetheine-binding protein [Streptomyces sp. NPDC052727]|uniref:acyl carrier protein n=1 Tax=unclassified Streptomyces TaxID=2593676 RepID=UPI003447E416